MSNQPCRYCGTELTRFEKLPDGKWKRYDKNGEHRYDICKAIQNQNNKMNKPVQQTVLSTHLSPPSGYVAGSSTFPVNEPEPTKTQGVSMFSLLNQMSTLKKAQEETNKRLETLATIADSINQQVELIVAKVGYPGPEPVVAELSQERARREIEEVNKPTIMAKVEQSRDFTCQSCGMTFTKGIVNQEKEEYICISCVQRGSGRKTDESGVQIKDGQEVKAVQRHPTEDELRDALSNRREIENTIVDTKEEVINPMRVQKYEENSKKFDEAFKQMNDDGGRGWETLWEQKQEQGGWEHLSEAFLCHSCGGKIHNGFINQAGTKVCEPCKLNLEANEEYENIQKAEEALQGQGKEDMNHPPPPLRSIEDINSENDY